MFSRIAIHAPSFSLIPFRIARAAQYPSLYIVKRSRSPYRFGFSNDRQFLFIY